MEKSSGMLSKSVWILILVSGICFVRGLEAKAITTISNDTANSLSREEIITPEDEPSSFPINKKTENIEDIVQLEENEKPLKSEGLSASDKNNKKLEIPDKVEALESAVTENGEPTISGRQIITVPDKKCPPGQRPDKNGRCRDILREPENIVRLEETEKSLKSEGLSASDEDNKKLEVSAKVEALRSAVTENGEPKMSGRQIITVPCPPGQRPDANGRCRVIMWESENVDGLVQLEKNKESLKSEDLLTNDEDNKEPEVSAKVEALESTVPENGKPEISGRQIITAPCPPGQRRDANGRCRDILMETENVEEIVHLEENEKSLEFAGNGPKSCIDTRLVLNRTRFNSDSSNL